MTNWVALSVFVVLFVVVTVLGFYGARWRAARDLASLNEWGLGGRRFGTVISWFLIGGDLYTAYTFVAVPALVFGVGAAGFFALPYTIILYPLGFLFLPRLWSVAHKHGYVTPADFVRGRYGSALLALMVALTGVLATMPYIALQLVGIQVVLEAMGVRGEGILNELPLVIAFLVLAAYTYQSGLRAPALIAFVKDVLIYVTVLVAVVYIPARLGGWGGIFDAAARVLPTRPEQPAALIPDAQGYWAYATLALGSALALWLYPHMVTATLSAGGRDVIRRNCAALPAYSFLLGLVALLGYMAIAAGIQVDDPNQAVPELFLRMFPDWFTGFAFSAVAIGALVPAAIMSIAVANLFTRNVWKEYVNRDLTDAQESRIAQVTSVVVKLGAVAFVVFIPTDYAINLQLLGGVWIIQTLPAVVMGLYTRWFHRWALLAGWAVGMVAGSLMAYSVQYESVFTLELFGMSVGGYHAFFALLLNFLVALVLTPLCNAARLGRGRDETASDDYEEFVEPEPAPVDTR